MIHDPNFFGYRFRRADFLYAWALHAGRDWKSIFLFGSVRREGTEGRTVSTAKLVPGFLGKAQAGCNTSALNTSNSLGASCRCVQILICGVPVPETCDSLLGRC